MYVGGCQLLGPVLGTQNIGGRITTGTPERDVMLTTPCVCSRVCGDD